MKSGDQKGELPCRYVLAWSVTSGRSDSFETLRAVAWEAPLSVGFSRQEDWSRLPLTTPLIFPTQGSNQHLLCLLHGQAGFFLFFFKPPAPPGKPVMQVPLDINGRRHTASLARSDTALLLPSGGRKIFSSPGNSLANQRLSQLSQWKPTMFQNPSFLQWTFRL